MEKRLPYQIGQTHWPFLAKTLEECAELNTVIGKMIAIGGKSNYFDGRNLHQELHEEIADVLCVVELLVRVNGLDRKQIEERMASKEKLLTDWHVEGILKSEDLIEDYA